MLVTLTEVVSTNSNQTGSSMATKVFTLREITINPQHVICLREDSVMANRLDEGTLPQGLEGHPRPRSVRLRTRHRRRPFTGQGKASILCS